MYNVILLQKPLIFTKSSLNFRHCGLRAAIPRVSCVIFSLYQWILARFRGFRVKRGMTQDFLQWNHRLIPNSSLLIPNYSAIAELSVSPILSRIIRFALLS